MIVFIAVAASLFTGAFLSAGCGQVITDSLMSLGLGPWGIFITMLLIILFLGMFIDWIGILTCVSACHGCCPGDGFDFKQAREGCWFEDYAGWAGKTQRFEPQVTVWMSRSTP